MPLGNHIIEFSRLHEKVHYVVADDERKDAVSTIFYVGWIVSGLIILYLALNHSWDAAMLALLAVAIAGSILWLINSCWKRRLYMKYSLDSNTERQRNTELPDEQ